MFKFSKSLVYSVSLLLAGSAAAAGAGATPPDLARTVDAFVGTWRMEGTQVLPDGVSEKGKLEFDCKKTALGKGVTCGMRGTFPKTGPWEGSFLIGYDTFGGKVHFMGMTSDESVHDHVCGWKGDSLVCDPLEGGSGGQPITEDLSFTFGANTFSMKVVVTLKDGRVLFDAHGKRR
jgi:hypothetical protein